LERICERIERDKPEVERRIARIVYEGFASIRLPGRWRTVAAQYFCGRPAPFEKTGVEKSIDTAR
jgi:hypothetical protein